MIDNSKEYILCAAWLRKEPRYVESNPYRGGTNEILNIEIGYRHHDIYLRFRDELSLEDGAMGFYTSKGRFVSREDGMKIAYESGQVEERYAKWSEEAAEELSKMNLLTEVGEFKPLASEDLYCSSQDGDSLHE